MNIIIEMTYTSHHFTRVRNIPRGVLHIRVITSTSAQRRLIRSHRPLHATPDDGQTSSHSSRIHLYDDNTDRLRTTDYGQRTCFSLRSRIFPPKIFPPKILLPCLFSFLPTYYPTWTTAQCKVSHSGRPYFLHFTNSSIRLTFVNSVSIFAPKQPKSKMAAAALGAEPHLGIHSSVDTDEHFRTVTPRKKKFKRKREGSLVQDFQAYSGTSTDSESEGTDTTISGTPSGS